MTVRSVLNVEENVTDPNMLSSGSCFEKGVREVFQSFPVLSSPKETLSETAEFCFGRGPRRTFLFLHKTGPKANLEQEKEFLK